MKIRYESYEPVGYWTWTLRPETTQKIRAKPLYNREELEREEQMMKNKGPQMKEDDDGGEDDEDEEDADEGEQEDEEDEDEDDDDCCGICQLEYESACPSCKVPGDDCPLIWGECTHVFHMHCLLTWLTKSAKEQCPLDRRTWVTADRGLPEQNPTSVPNAADPPARTAQTTS